MNGNRKPIFFTSDTHYGHENVIKYDERPFGDLEHMHRVLVNNYNSVVPNNGICYFLGDVGFLSNLEFRKILSQLNGTKVLVSGNHDKGHNAMYDLGFDCVLNNAGLFIAGEMVTMSHCPLTGVLREVKTSENWHGESKNGKFSIPNYGQYHLHGHIHASKDRRILGKQYDVGVRANNYAPVSIKVIESWIAKNKQVKGNII